MRLLAYFIHEYQYGKVVGGAAYRFLELSKVFKQEKVKLYVIEPYPSLSKTWLEAGYSSFEVREETHRFPSIVKLLLTLRSLTMTGLKVARTEHVDAIYVTRHDLIENVIPAYIVSRITRRPLVVVFHHLRPRDRWHLGRLFSERRKIGWNPIANVTYASLETFSSTFLRKAELSFAVSNATARDAEYFLGVKNIIVSGNGVSLRGQLSGAKSFDGVFCGRLEGPKGLGVLIHAWKEIVHDYPLAKLAIIGGAERNENLKEYQSLIDSLGLTDNARLFGFVGGDERRRTLRKSRIFILPSAREGFSLATLEAMSMGLPCVLSDLPALREVYDGVAIFVPYGNPDILAKTILDLLRDANKRQELARKGLALAGQLTWEKVAERELTILSTFLRTRYRHL